MENSNTLLDQRSYKMNKLIFPEIKTTFLLFLPLLLSQVTYAISTFIGTAMIGQLGKDALAALALVSSTYSCLCALFYGVFVSIGILVSEAVGAKQYEKIREITSQGFMLALAFSVIFMAILWYMPYLFQMTGQSQAVVDVATSYLHALSYSIFPWLVLVVMEQTLIGLSLTKVIFWFSCIQVPLEIAVNYVFIFGKLGIPAFGIAGLGYGFTVAFILAAVFMVFFINNSAKTHQYQIFSQIGKFKFQLLFNQVRLGLPIGLINFIEYVLFPALAILMGKFGADALAGQQIARQYFEIAVTVGLALAQATTVRVSQASGENNFFAVKSSAMAGAIIGLIFTLAVLLIYAFFPHLLIMVDIDAKNASNTALITYAEQFLLMVGFFLIIDMLRLTVISSLRGLKDTNVPMIITVITYWFICFPTAYLLSVKFNYGAIGVWYGLIIGVMIGTIILLIRFQFVLRKIHKNFEMNNLML